MTQKSQTGNSFTVTGCGDATTIHTSLSSYRHGHATCGIYERVVAQGGQYGKGNRFVSNKKRK